MKHSNPIPLIVLMLTLAVAAVPLSGQSYWQGSLLTYWNTPDERHGDFFLDFHDWTIDAAGSGFTLNRVDSTDPSSVMDTFSGTIERRGPLGGIVVNESVDSRMRAPISYFSESGNFLFANSGVQGLTSTGSLLSVRMDPDSTVDITGEWMLIQYEVESWGNKLDRWGYERFDIVINADGTLEGEMVESTIDTEMESFSLNYRREGGMVIFEMDEDEDEVVFHLSASGDLMLKREIEREGDRSEGIVTYMLRLADADAFTAADAVGTWILNAMEFGKGHNGFGDWVVMDSETIYLVLYPDLSGELRSTQSTFHFDSDDLEDAAAELTWDVEDGNLVITSYQGEVSEPGEAPEFRLGASGEIILSAEIDDDDDRLYVLFDCFVRIGGVEWMPPAVRDIPMFSPIFQEGYGYWFRNQERLYTGLWPWVNFERIGWMYVVEGGNGQDVWLWDAQTGTYLMTNFLIFPYFVGTEAGEVYWVDLDNSQPGKRMVYGWLQGTWLD